MHDPEHRTVGLLHGDFDLHEARDMGHHGIQVAVLGGEGYELSFAEGLEHGVRAYSHRYRWVACARSARARASKAAAPAAVQSPSACSRCAAACGTSPRAEASSPSDRATGPSLAA